MTRPFARETAERLRLGVSDYLWHGDELQDVAGRRVPLRAKSLRMFGVLLTGRGTVMSKDRLVDLVWPGRVASDESIARCIADIRKALDDGTHSIVETFPRQGYRLNVTAAPRDSTQSPSFLRARWAIPVGVVCTVAALAAGAWFLEVQGSEPEEAATPILPVTDLREAVAILPFSRDEGNDGLLAAGLADELEIKLAEMSGIKTVSRAQSVSIVGSGLSPVEMARALDARYLVGGSVQPRGEDIVVSVRLIEGYDGTTLWADRYDGPRSGSMSFLHALPEALLGAMSVALNAHDRRRLAMENTSAPEAFEEVMRARLAISAFTYKDSLDAEKHLRRAIERDPGYAHAYAELAAALAIRFENGWVVLSTADAEKAFYFAERALELDPELWLAHYALGRLHSVTPFGDVEEALRHLRKAMSLQPANDDARIYYAVVTMMSGRPEVALPVLESVISAHPRAPFWYYLALGNTLFHLRRYDEAEAALKTCLDQMPNSPHCLRILIATYARLGRSEDAEWMLEEYALLGHDTSMDALIEGAMERDTELRAHLSESYRQLGLE